MEYEIFGNDHLVHVEAW